MNLLLQHKIKVHCDIVSDTKQGVPASDIVAAAPSLQEVLCGDSLVTQDFVTMPTNAKTVNACLVEPSTWLLIVLKFKTL